MIFIHFKIPKKQESNWTLSQVWMCTSKALIGVLLQIFHQGTAQMVDDHHGLWVFAQELGCLLELMPVGAVGSLMIKKNWRKE